MMVSSAILVFIFGLVVGSFLNVCIYRIPIGKSVVYPPSSCPNCNMRIRWYDNIPVLSYIMLKGKCRYCKHPISPIYPAVELLSGFTALALFLKYGYSFEFAIYLIFSYMLIVASFIDSKYYIIPDRISIGLIVLGIILSYFLKLGIKGSIIGAASGFTVLFIVAVLGKIVFKKEAMGGGDIKLLSGIGAFLGIKGVFFTLFVSSFLGSIIGVGLIMAGKKDMASKLPFGPYLSCAAVLYLFFGKWLFKTLYGF